MEKEKDIKNLNIGQFSIRRPKMEGGGERYIRAIAKTIKAPAYIIKDEKDSE